MFNTGDKIKRQHGNVVLEVKDKKRVDDQEFYSLSSEDDKFSGYVSVERIDANYKKVE